MIAQQQLLRCLLFFTPRTGEQPQCASTCTCAECGGTITSLPLELRNTSNLTCIDCFKKSKG